MRDLLTSDALIGDILRTAKLPDAIVEEVISGIQPQKPAIPQVACETDLVLSYKTDDYETPVSGKSERGMFTLQGDNNTGKTTLLVVAAILLGTDWLNDENLANFLTGEERYLDTGRRIQSEMERGMHAAKLVISTQDTSIAVAIEGGNIEVSIGADPPRSFRVLDDGWRLFQDYLRPFAQVKFIPQKRDFLRQVYSEVSSSIMQGLEHTRQFLKLQRGDLRIDSVRNELGLLARDAERARNDFKLACEELHRLEMAADAMKKILVAQDASSDMFERSQQWANLKHAKDSLMRTQSAISPKQAELDELKAWVDAHSVLHERAASALNSLEASVEGELARIQSNVLRTKLSTLIGRNKIGDWLEFFVEYRVASPALYSQLERELAESPQEERTFVLTDDLFERTVYTIADLTQLMGDYVQWARDFSQLLLPHFETFGTDIAESIELRDEDLAHIQVDLTNRQWRVNQCREELENLELQMKMQRGEIVELLPAVGADNSDALLSRAESRLEILHRPLTEWTAGEEIIGGILSRFGYDEVDFWRGGGAAPALAKVGTEIEEIRKRVNGFREDMLRAETALETRRIQHETRPEFQYAHALDSIESLIPLVSTLLQSPLRSAAYDSLYSPAPYLLNWQPPGTTDSVDIYSSLVAGVKHLVRDRCGSFFGRDDNGMWTSWPIASVDLKSGVLEVVRNDKTEYIRIKEQLGTGVGAALTVRSLSSLLHAPSYFTVLLVDEWGDVQQDTLAQTLYNDLTDLPNRVIALFTLPGDPARLALEDAQLTRGNHA